MRKDPIGGTEEKSSPKWDTMPNQYHDAQQQSGEVP
jgi:hypothetical protein